MATTILSFNVGLYEEHLEEAAFLYEQRLALLDNPEVSWTEIGEFEERLEAHLDGLVVGGELALQVCRERVKQGEPGQLYAVLALCCRYRNAPMLAETLRSLDFADEAKVRALGEALKHELPQEWIVFCEQALQRRDARLGPLLAAACAFRRFPVGGALHAYVSSLPPAEVGAPLVSALGRLATPEAAQVFWTCLRHPQPVVRSAALLALARLGDRNALPHGQAHITHESWPCIALAVGGDAASAAALYQVAAAGAPSADHVFAMGWLGDLGAVRPLLALLQHPGLGPDAAQALYVLTGAPLFEEEFVPEPVRKDELLDSELKAWNERRELPKRPDGTPFGSKVRRLTLDPQAWNQWLAAHAQSFRAGTRYRRGQPFTPELLLREIAGPANPRRVRQLAYEELAVRYGCPVPFEADMRASWQAAGIAEMGRWLAAHQTAFTPGRWYFAGRTG